MRYLGIDLGSKTVGLALSDTTHTIATPYKTIFFPSEDYECTLEEIKKITLEYDIDKIIIGLPKNMNNTLGTRALQTLEYKKMLEEYLKMEVIPYDERLTSVISNSLLIEADMRRENRKKKVDAVAASVILQDYLDKEKMQNE